jgi:hypothetical protein
VVIPDEESLLLWESGRYQTRWEVPPYNLYADERVPSAVRLACRVQAIRCRRIRDVDLIPKYHHFTSRPTVASKVILRYQGTHMDSHMLFHPRNHSLRRFHFTRRTTVTTGLWDLSIKDLVQKQLPETHASTSSTVFVQALLPSCLSCKRACLFAGEEPLG